MCVTQTQLNFFLSSILVMNVMRSLLISGFAPVFFPILKAFSFSYSLTFGFDRWVAGIIPVALWANLFFLLRRRFVVGSPHSLFNFRKNAFVSLRLMASGLTFFLFAFGLPG